MKMLDPRFLPVIVPASFAIKFIVDGLRQWLKLDGNVVQTASYLMGFPVAAALGYFMGVFDNGIHRPEVFSWILTAVSSGAAAIGVHETVSEDRNTH